MNSPFIKEEHKAILELVEPGSTALDLGCGSGDLLALLVQEKKIKGQGIEIDEQAIYDCVAKGLSVFHGDLDRGLSEYRDKSFDYVILNESMQELKKPDFVLQQALRVGKKVIVSFPNFVHYKSRLQFFFTGRTPITPSLPFKWYDTPNLHFLSILDFKEYCKSRNVTVEKFIAIANNKRIKFLTNLLGETGIFLISRNGN